MTIAVLFNSDHPTHGVVYGEAIRDMIFGTNVLQNSNLHMKVRVGDVLTNRVSYSNEKIIELSEKTYFWHPWRGLNDSELRATYVNATVFAWVIQNIDIKTAEGLHDALGEEPSYLGMHAVDFSYPVHLVLYRNSMISRYRVNGSSCHVFFSMSEEDGKDDYEIADLKELHFQTVDWEDRGAHGTIFDDYDTPEHFQQVAEFKGTISPYLPEGEFTAEGLVLLLEDLNPKLFDVLGAAVRTLARAKSSEDFAQVGLSGRRYIEQLADALFPAQAQLHNGRKVTKEMFKNRIWAYIDSSVPDLDASRDAKVNALGGKVDRLIKEVNITVHSDTDKARMTQTLTDLAQFTIVLLQLNPESARRPYLPFEKNMQNFIEQARDMNLM